MTYVQMPSSPLLVDFYRKRMQNLTYELYHFGAYAFYFYVIIVPNTFSALCYPLNHKLYLQHRYLAQQRYYCCSQFQS